MSFQFNSLSWGAELEWPQEVVGLFEVRTNCDDFVDEVFNANDSVFAEFLFDNAVVGQRKSLSVSLSESSLVDEVSDGLGGGVTISNVRLNLSNHVDGGLV